jgi:anthranilate synthase component 1
VAKSDVEYELQEVNNKLGALRKAIEAAEEPHPQPLSEKRGE